MFVLRPLQHITNMLGLHRLTLLQPQGLSAWDQQRSTEISSQSTYNCVFVDNCPDCTEKNHIKHALSNAQDVFFIRILFARVICQCVGEKTLDFYVTSSLCLQMTWTHGESQAAEHRGTRQERKLEEVDMGWDALHGCDNLLPFPVLMLRFTYWLFLQLGNIQ